MHPFCQITLTACLFSYASVVCLHASSVTPVMHFSITSRVDIAQLYTQRDAAYSISVRRLLHAVVLQEEISSS